MGLSYTIDETLNLITIAGEYADASEWVRVLQLILTDERRRPGCLVLRDLRGSARPVDVGTVVAIMEVVRHFWLPMDARRAAIVMPRDFDPLALAAQAIADTHNLPIQAFREYDAAIEWLLESARR